MHPTVPKPQVGKTGPFVHRPGELDDLGSDAELEDVVTNDPEAAIDEEMDDLHVNEGADDRDFDEDGDDLYRHDNDHADDEELDPSDVSDLDHNRNEPDVRQEMPCLRLNRNLTKS